MRVLATCAWLIGLCAAASGQALRDDFDDGVIESSTWSSQQILPKQLDVLKPGRCGAAAIDIITRDGDGGLACDDDCQRAELRTAKNSWPTYGDEVWYSFSFRLKGPVSNTGSTRFVIGQWKGPGDQSPMIAQRFDNGIFHITVQDNETRRVVANAEGFTEEMVEAQDLLAKLDPKDLRVVESVKSLQSIDQLAKSQPRIAKELFKDDFLDGLVPDVATTQSNRLADALGLDENLVSRFGALSYVADPEKYLGPADIEILPEPNKPLPDPKEGWVDMIYKINPGRLDNEYGPKKRAEIEIWANGAKIVTVRGNIGATLKGIAPTEKLSGPYFKFGTYRLRIPGTFHYQFDEFSQSPSHAGLAQLCPAH